MISNMFFNLKEIFKGNYGILLAGLVGFTILSLPSPDPVQIGSKIIELSVTGQNTLALLGVIFVIFITEALPIGASIALIYAWIVFFNIVPAKNAAEIFSHDAVWFLIGALMMAEVLVKYGIHKRILVLILRLVGSKVKFISLGIIAFCAISASFIAEHTIAALMLPIGIALIQLNGGYSKVPNLSKLIMLSIAFGAGVGGLGSPSGGGRNVIMMGFLEDIYNVNIGYGSWMIMAMPIVIVLIPVIWVILHSIFKPEVSDLKESFERIKEEMHSSKMAAKDWGVVVIFLTVLFLWFTSSEHGIGMIAMFGSLVYIIVKLARWADYQKINWGIALLYFGAIGLGKALIMTGAASWLGAKFLNTVGLMGISGGFALIMACGVLVCLFSQTMSNGPCIAAIGPTLLEAAKFAGVDPIVVGIGASIASTFAFILIIGCPPNAIVSASGFLRARDFRNSGALVAIISLIVMGFFIYFWWSFLGVGIDGFH